MKSEWIAWLCVLAVMAIVITEAFSIIDIPHAANLILALTVIAIVWYTAETAKLRRDAEDRSRRQLEPLVGFYIERKETNVLPPLVSLSPYAFHQTQSLEKKIRIRFVVRNHSPNPALLRVFIRLREGNRVGRFDEHSPYGGRQVWELIPFDGIDAWFDFVDLLVRTRGNGQASQWPQDKVAIAADVHVYWRDRTLQASWTKEFKVRVDTQRSEIICWPEIAVQSFQRIKPEDTLPKDVPSAELTEFRQP